MSALGIKEQGMQTDALGNFTTASDTKCVKQENTLPQVPRHAFHVDPAFMAAPSSTPLHPSPPTHAATSLCSTPPARNPMRPNLCPALIHVLIHLQGHCAVLAGTPMRIFLVDPRLHPLTEPLALSHHSQLGKWQLVGRTEELHQIYR